MISLTGSSGSMGLHPALEMGELRDRAEAASASHLIGMTTLIWGGTAITWFALTLYIFVNVGFFLVILRNRGRFHLAWTVVPVLGVLLSIAVLYKSFIQSLWNAGWVTIGFVRDARDVVECHSSLNNGDTGP